MFPTGLILQMEWRPLELVSVVVEVVVEDKKTNTKTLILPDLPDALDSPVINFACGMVPTRSSSRPPTPKRDSP